MFVSIPVVLVGSIYNIHLLFPYVIGTISLKKKTDSIMWNLQATTVSAGKEESH